MTSETAISRWLRTEMPRRGYPIEGHRAGGISRLAEDAGIPQATMSRIVNGRAEPSIESLRKLAHLWNTPLGEILVHAGYADLNDLHVPTTPRHGPAAEPVSIPHWVDLSALAEWERHVWLTPGLTVQQREIAILLVRLERGDLEDDTEGLLRLYYALGKVVERRYSNGNPHHHPPWAV